MRLPSLMFAASLAISPACQMTQDPQGLKDELVGILYAQQEAWNEGDIETFVQVGYWHSPELTFFSGGDVTKGYDPLVARYRERYLESSDGMGTLTFSNLEPIPLGDSAAIVRGRWSLDRGQDEPLGGLFTLILRHIEGQWLIVHDHTSIPTAPLPED